MSDINVLDQRKFQRLKMECRVEFRQCFLHEQLLNMEWQNGVTVNVSKNGLCLETLNMTDQIIKYLRKQNAFLEVRFKLPLSLQKVRFVGEIVWYERDDNGKDALYRMGLKFRTISKDDKRALLNFIDAPKSSLHFTILIVAVLGLLGLSLFLL
jgi:hypothetical protein